LLVRAQRAIVTAEKDTVHGLNPREASVLMELLGRIAAPDKSAKLATGEEVSEALARPV